MARSEVSASDGALDPRRPLSSSGSAPSLFRPPRLLRTRAPLSISCAPNSSVRPALRSPPLAGRGPRTGPPRRVVHCGHALLRARFVGCPGGVGRRDPDSDRLLATPARRTSRARELQPIHRLPPGASHPSTGARRVFSGATGGGPPLQWVGQRHRRRPRLVPRPHWSPRSAVLVGPGVDRARSGRRRPGDRPTPGTTSAAGLNFRSERPGPRAALRAGGMRTALYDPYRLS